MASRPKTSRNHDPLLEYLEKAGHALASARGIMTGEWWLRARGEGRVTHRDLALVDNEIDLLEDDLRAIKKDLRVVPPARDRSRPAKKRARAPGKKRAARDRSRGFPIGAKVLIDGRDVATVRGYFPEGSSSYLYPHYKVDVQGGDRGMVVQIKRVGVKRAPARDSKRRYPSAGMHHHGGGTIWVSGPIGEGESATWYATARHRNAEEDFSSRRGFDALMDEAERWINERGAGRKR